MTCPNCGAEVGDNRRFCGKCGAEVAAAPSPTASPPSAPPPTAPPSTWGAPGTSPAPPPPPPPPAAERDPFAAPDLYAPPAYGAPQPPGYPPPPYGYPPPQGYPPGAWPGYGPAPSNNGFAITSLVLGLVGWFPCGIGSVLAIVFGFVARDQIKRSQGRQTGSGMATAGIILGFIAVAFWLFVFIVALADAGSNA